MSRKSLFHASDKKSRDLHATVSAVAASDRRKKRRALRRLPTDDVDEEEADATASIPDAETPASFSTLMRGPPSCRPAAPSAPGGRGRPRARPPRRRRPRPSRRGGGLRGGAARRRRLWRADRARRLVRQLMPDDFASTCTTPTGSRAIGYAGFWSDDRPRRPDGPARHRLPSVYEPIASGWHGGNLTVVLSPAEAPWGSHDGGGGRRRSALRRRRRERAAAGVRTQPERARSGLDECNRAGTSTVSQSSTCMARVIHISYITLAFRS